MKFYRSRNGTLDMNSQACIVYTVTNRHLFDDIQKTLELLPLLTAIHDCNGFL